MIFYEQPQQGTQEWLDLRKGKFTASDATAIGNQKAGLDTLVYKKACEMLSSGKYEELVNKDVQRGNELEPIARDIYELQTGRKVYEVGFVQLHEASLIGCSPDGMLDEEGLAFNGGIEIKCPNDTNYIKYLATGKIPSAHEWQMQMQMLVTGTFYWDYVVYNPNFKRSLAVQRIERSPDKEEALKSGFIKAEKKLKALLSQLKSMSL